MPRRPAVQCDRVTVQSTVVCSVGSAFLSSGSTMGKVWKADEHPAIVSASGADSSTDYKPVANRKQLDQLFETLSTEHSIVTAQCLSHAAYQDFEAQIRRRGADSKAIGCCYFAVSAPSIILTSSKLLAIPKHCFANACTYDMIAHAHGMSARANRMRV